MRIGNAQQLQQQHTVHHGWYTGIITASNKHELPSSAMFQSLLAAQTHIVLPYTE